MHFDLAFSTLRLSNHSNFSKIMLLPYSVVALLLPTLALSASPPSQLYFSPPPPRSSSSSSSSSQSPISLSAAQANAVLAHHLGVSSYVDLPLSSSKQGGREWEEALYVSPSSTSKFIIVLDCPKQGCHGTYPSFLSLFIPR